MARRQRRVRNYCFTLFGYTPAIVAKLLEAVDDGPIKYLIMQEEISPGTERVHLQGYMELTAARTMSSIKRALEMPTLHLEERRGTQAQAIAYCRKEETRRPNGGDWEKGTKKGIRGNGAIQLVIAGTDMKVIAEEFPAEYVRSFRGLVALQLILSEERTWPMEIHIYYGQTGTGKSYEARRKYSEAYWLPLPGKRQVMWWPNYHGEEVVIIDEYREQISFPRILVLLDRYPMKVQMKGGFYQFSSRIIVFTTNIDPENWYSDSVEDRTPLMRRFRDFAKIHDFHRMDRDEEGLPVINVTMRNMDEI